MSQYPAGLEFATQAPVRRFLQIAVPLLGLLLVLWLAAPQQVPRGAAPSEAALECGFADQAHLTREFVEFSGAPPRRWLTDVGVRASGTNLQDFAPPAS